MIYIRSTLFHLFFYGMNLVLCFAMLWVLSLPRKWAFNALFYGYFNLIYLMEKYILGLDFKLEGRENIPQDRSYIIAMKHQSAYETLILFHLFGDIRIILKRELMLIPLWGWYAKKLGMIPIDRGAKGKAVQSMLDNSRPVIESNIPVLIYPQGTRVSIHDTPKTKPYKQGILRLYETYNIPIVPVAMNSGVFWPRKSFLIKPGTVTFKVMPPIPPGQNTDDVFTRLRETLEKESSDLLP